MVNILLQRGKSSLFHRAESTSLNWGHPHSLQCTLLFLPQHLEPLSLPTTVGNNSLLFTPFSSVLVPNNLCLASSVHPPTHPPQGQAWSVQLRNSPHELVSIHFLTNSLKSNWKTLSLMLFLNSPFSRASPHHLPQLEYPVKAAPYNYLSLHLKPKFCRDFSQ